MENLGMDNQMLYIIGGAALLLIILLVVIIKKRKKKKSKGPKVEMDSQVFEKVEAAPEGVEASEEEIASAPKLELEKFNDGINALSFRFKVSGAKMKLDSIDPNNNAWIEVANYSELIGQSRSSDQMLHVFMNRKNRKKASRREAATISMVYSEEAGQKWLQKISYNSDSGAKLEDLRKLN